MITKEVKYTEKPTTHALNGEMYTVIRMAARCPFCDTVCMGYRVYQGNQIECQAVCAHWGAWSGDVFVFYRRTPTTLTTHVNHVETNKVSHEDMDTALSMAHSAVKGAEALGFSFTRPTEYIWFGSTEHGDTVTIEVSIDD